MPIRGKTLRPSSFATIQVHVDEYSVDVFKGRVYHIASNRLIGFSGTYDFLTRLEGFYDEFSFPQATHEYRTFRKNAASAVMSAQADHTVNMEEDKGVKEKEIKIEPSGKGTFIIKVLYRQNATWQGSIQWVEGKKTQNFRSDLEMLKLIDDALRTGDEEDDSAKWDQA